MPMVFLLYAWLYIGTFEGWDTLQKLDLKTSYDEFLGEATEVPVFSTELKSYDGQEVTIEGYVIPLETTANQKYFVLSRFPFNNCFFCGNAGPETVAEVYADETITFQDAKVRVTGTLRLNADDPLHLFFIFEASKVKRLD